MRKAFSMVTAIFVILILATISVLVLNTAGQITQNTTLQYRQEQAALLAKSYTEFAIMSVLNHDKTAGIGSCVENINSGNILGGANYSARVAIYYIGNNLPCTAGNILNTTPITQNLAVGVPYSPDVIIDVFVSYTDSLNPAKNITYHRRSLQKI
jgi:hypothetical protein